MKIYLVGGAVRDKLMGNSPKDLDYVVIGATREELRALGYIEVGLTFPVYLHPQTKAEHSLPKGPTLEEDLRARDLTINAMAMDEAGELIDPFGGQRDLKSKILRHVSDAFSEDPLRVFRVFRFLARFPDFKIAPETIEMMKRVVTTPEFKLITQERIAQEMKFALETKKPSLFFEGLKSIGGLEEYFPELKNLIGVPQNPTYHPEGDAWVHTMLVLDQAACLTENILVRYSALVHDLGKGVTPTEILPKHIGHEESGVKLVETMSKRLLIQNDWIEAAITVTRFHLRVYRLSEMKANSIVRMFYEMDAFRKPNLVKILALASQADEMGKMKSAETSKSQLEVLFDVIKDVSVRDVSPELEGKAIGEGIRVKRIEVLKNYLF